ncbi:3-phosphoshikimate 1-carboxyvinyltransferase [Simkania sp.]|uniref:3-phosphoshikimate 1-carboxyvinyltransferase n=1 Tax=Simkania sp. TaxID=34094 RepID=UPI003B521677
MKHYLIKKSSLKGTLEIPTSKSHTLRAILFGMMGKGKTTVRKYLQSPDAVAMIEAIKNFGASVDMFPDRLEIEGVAGKMQPADDVVSSGNSGQVLRFIGALAALLPTYTILTGDHSIRHNRPVKPLLEGLQSLGVFAESMRLDGFAPILIKGPCKGGRATLEGQDSQPVSGLLVASSFAEGPTEIEVRNPGEKPWIDLTLHWFDILNLPYQNNDYTFYHIPGGGGYDGFDYTVPGDFSSLAFPVAAALITDSDVAIENVDMDDVQGDKKIIEVLIEMGAKIEIDKEKRTLHIKKGSKLKGMKMDINDYIDAITILAVVGCYADGTTEIQNAAIARSKECDRIHAIATELKKMGADIEEKEDGLVVRTSTLQGAAVESYHDHRMVMSLSVAALGAKGETQVMGVECVSKTYPTFAEHFQLLGANLQEQT